MTSGYSISVANAVQDQVLRGVAYPFAAADRISLHTADPGLTGANEVVNSGGSTYSRQVGVWGAAVGGVSALTANVDFNNMPPGTINYFGVWTAAGQFQGGAPCTNRTLVQGDSFRLNTGTTFTASRSP